MIKKLVPLAALIGSTVAIPNYIQGSTWNAGATPTFAGTPGTQTGTAASVATCCFFKNTLSFGTDTSVTGTLTPAQSGTPSAASDVCNPYTNAITGTETVTNFAVPTPTSAILASRTTAPVTTFTTNPTGTTLTITTTNPSGTNTALKSDAICSQTLTRSDAAASTDFVGTWAVGTGTPTSPETDSTCCFFASGTPLTVTNTNNVLVTSGAKTSTASGCATPNTEFANALEAGTTATQAVPRLYNGELFTINAAKDTITYTPKSGCSQTLTKVSGSALHLAMTPVVVGAAVMGLIAV